VISSLEDFAQGGFQRIIPDSLPAAHAAKVILCSGKIYYELEHKRAELERNDVAILRIEQLYPLRRQTLAMHLDRYMSGTPVLWVQEEPENMGAWPYLKLNFGEELLGRFPFMCVSRPRSASPATGSAARHKIEQEQLLANAFGAA
jgi:2-oxoglutarate dehydrogenase E1 component